jgi:hypothetical protein
VNAWEVGAQPAACMSVSTASAAARLPAWSQAQTLAACSLQAVQACFYVMCLPVHERCVQDRTGVCFCHHQRSPCGNVWSDASGPHLVHHRPRTATA